MDQWLLAGWLAGWLLGYYSWVLSDVQAVLLDEKGWELLVVLNLLIITQNHNLFAPQWPWHKIQVRLPDYTHQNVEWTYSWWIIKGDVKCCWEITWAPLKTTPKTVCIIKMGLNTSVLPGLLLSLTWDKLRIMEPNSCYSSHNVDYRSIPPLLYPLSWTPDPQTWPLTFLWHYVIS